MINAKVTSGDKPAPSFKGEAPWPVASGSVQPGGVGMPAFALALTAVISGHHQHGQARTATGVNLKAHT